MSEMTIIEKETIISNYFGIDLSKIGNGPFILRIGSSGSNNGSTIIDIELLNTNYTSLSNEKGIFTFYTDLNTFKQKNNVRNELAIFNKYGDKEYTKDALITMLYDFILHKVSDLKKLQTISVFCEYQNQNKNINIVLNTKIQKHSHESFSSLGVQKTLKYNFFDVSLRVTVSKIRLSNYFDKLEPKEASIFQKASGIRMVSNKRTTNQYQYFYNELLELIRQIKNTLKQRTDQKETLQILIQQYIATMLAMAKTFKIINIVENTSGKPFNLYQDFISFLEGGQDFNISFRMIPTAQRPHAGRFNQLSATQGAEAVPPRAEDATRVTEAAEIVSAHLSNPSIIPLNQLEGHNASGESLSPIERLRRGQLTNRQTVTPLRGGNRKSIRKTKKKSKTQKPKSKRS